MSNDLPVPPRPAPPRTPWERAAGWLRWIGPARVVVAAASLAMVAGAAVWLLREGPPDPVAGLPMATSPSTSPAVAAPVVPASSEPAATAPTNVVVHVAGQVAAPGVYSLPNGARVDAAVRAAGGAGPGADLDAVNLAAPIADGQRIYVPAEGEVVAVVASPSVPGATVARGPVDLNSATAAEFEQLPGVGPATAAAIVDDRDTNGPFASVDDLDRVPGIGPAKLAALRDLVTT